ncbi:Uncharacterised protein [Providencia stuartii]|nr:hypothetical protein [Providencia stuartii]SUC44452.1 Uncharacterised protein [Providencia stuartii]
MNQSEEHLSSSKINEGSDQKTDCPSVTVENEPLSSEPVGFGGMATNPYVRIISYANYHSLYFIERPSRAARRFGEDD